ncbi:MAG: FtsH protease activity modulator HflK [Alphaproteobacteria bacterium]
MPWNNQGGGRWQGGQGPWGGRPTGGGPSGGGGGGGGQQPPDLEELIRRSQEKVKKWFPGGAGGGGFGNKRIIAIGAVVLIGLWLLSGFYRVQPAERGVELMFGQFYEVTEPGLQYALPAPIQTVIKPEVERVNRVEIGFRSGGGNSNSVREISGESLMLTGDENIVDINFVVLWKISVPQDFLFNVRDPEETVKAAAESVMRELIGKTPIAEATTQGRGVVETDARAQMQSLLEDYGAGILITEIQLQKADPPDEVIEAFRDVQRAQADRERLQNEAEAFANDIIPRARGEAERLIQEAEAYKQTVEAQASGEASRFNAIYNEYADAREVTAQRIYLETMETVLRDMNKLVIDGEASGASGVVPYLPLPNLQERQVRQTSASGDDGGSSTSGTSSDRGGQ